MNNTQIKSAPLPERSIEHLTRCTVLSTSDMAHYMSYPALREAGYAALLCSILKSKCTASNGKIILLPSCSIIPAFSIVCTSRCTDLKSRCTRRDSSRMVIAPAPAIVLMMVSRLGASMTRAKSSMLENENTNGSSGCFPVMACSNASPICAHASFSGNTFTVNVFMVLTPHRGNVSTELFNQIFQGGKADGVFILANMLVISLTRFIVVAHHADPINDINKAVFVVVLAGGDVRINPPYLDTYKSVFPREVVFLIHHYFRWHLLFPLADGNNNINIIMMSMKPSKALDRLNCWRYSYPAPHKTGAGISTPKLLQATPDAASVFFVVRYTRHSMAWCALFNAGSAAAITHNGVYHVAHNGAVRSNRCAGLAPNPLTPMNAPRRPIMVTLAGLPKGRPVPCNAGSANPVNVTAPIEISTSSGDSLNLLQEAVYHG